jgi:hypothetical protein
MDQNLDDIFAENFRALEAARSEKLKTFQRSEPKQTTKGLRKALKMQHMRERMEVFRSHYDCEKCSRKKTVFEDDHAGSMVCTACGHVRTGAVLGDYRGLGSWFPELGRPSGNSYRRTTHYRERISQRNMAEPSVKEEFMEQITVAYERLVAEEPDRFGKGRVLTKEDISHVLRAAGLEKRSLLERWISIRHALTKYVPPEIPSSVLNDMEDDFSNLSDAWNSDRNIRTLNGQVKRRNIINFNFIFHQLLLRQGNDMWLRYKDEFPQVSDEKRADLFLHYEMICDRLEWPCLCWVQPASDDNF